MAAECLLGLPVEHVIALARSIIEGAAANIAACLAPEELGSDPARVADQIEHAAADELQLIGLEVVTLGLRGVTDEFGYLETLRKLAT